MTRFIVLRDGSGNWTRSAVPALTVMEPNRPDEPGDPQLEITDLSRKELDDFTRQPGFLGIAPVMPTRLLSPEPMDDLRGDDVVPGWGQHAVGADWTRFDGQGARVALLDTGIDPKHPCFAGVALTARDFAGTGIEDANGHGTHLAGTVLGRDMGGTRIGVARGVERLIVGKALTDSGHGDSGNLLRALLWAHKEGAQIVGFALGYDTAAHIEQLGDEGFPMALAAAAAVHAYRGNLRVFESVLRMLDPATRPLVVGAVGNDSLRSISAEFETGPAAPAAARGALAIGAFGPGEAGLVPAPFSNCGPTLVAPGVGIVSASAGGGVRSLNGSSMAMAHTLGVAALWAECLRDEGRPVNAVTLADRLIGTATRTGLTPNLSMLDRGHGMVQAPPGSLD